MQAFKLLDQEGKGYISHQDVYRLLATSVDAHDSTSYSNAPRVSFIDNLRLSSMGGSVVADETHPDQMQSVKASLSHVNSSFSQEIDIIKNLRLKRIQAKVNLPCRDIDRE